MAQDLEQMVLTISADTRQIMRAMKKLEGDTKASTKAIEKQFDGLGKKVNGTFAGVGKGLLGGLAAAFTVREAQKLIDTATRIDNALKVAGLSGEQLTKVYDELFVSAQKNAAPLESLVQLYGRASLVQKELGVSTEQLLKFTDNVAVALRVSGKSAAESSGALLQLSQALGSGVVRAEEFNSMLEGALPIVQAAANGIEEAGGSVAKLRSLVVEGKVSSAAFFKGFQAGAAMLNQQVAGSSFTVAQGFERLQNAAIDAAKKINDAAGISKTATNVLDGLAAMVERLAGAFVGLANNGGLKETSGQIDGIAAAARNLWNDPSFQNLYEFLFDASGSRAKLAATDAITARAEGLKALGDAMRKANAEATAATKKDGKAQPSKFDQAFAPFATKKISLKDNPVTADAEKAKARKNALEREIQAMNEDIRAMDLQRQMIGATNYERERAKALLDLTNAAQRAGITLDAEKTAALEALATKYAQASEAAQNAKDKYEAVNELTREFGQMGLSAIEGLIDGTKSLNDVLADTLKRLSQMVLQAALLGDGPLASLFGSKSSGGGAGGLLGLITGGLTGGGSSTVMVGNYAMPKFAKGTDFAPGGMALVGENGPEILNIPRGGQVIPNDVLRRSAGGSQAITYAPNIDARGASVEAVARLEQMMRRDRAEFEARTIAAVRKAGRGRML